MTRPLRGAVIGTGYFSRFHFDAWRRIDGVDIVACCDADADKASGAAAEFDVDESFDDFRRMLDNVEVDFVDVVTRPDTHVKICREIAGRGINLICQKPLAPTADEAAELVRATDGVRMMVHENFRFQPWYREIKRQMRNGVIGDRLHTITFRNRAGDGHGPGAYLARQPYFQTMERFLIFEAGVHTVDTFRYLGGEVDRVWCMHRRLNPVIAGEDTALAVMDFVGDGVGVYDANRFNESTADDPRYTFGTATVEGDGGTLRLSDDGRLTVQPIGEPEREIAYDHSRHGFAGDCVHATQQHFIDRLRDDEPFETSGAEYLKTIAVVEAMYASADSGTWEAVPR